MTKLFYLLIIISTYGKAQGDKNAVVLKVSEITSIEMKKVNPKNSKLQRELFLKPKDIEGFVSRRNEMNADTVTESYKPKYFFFVNLKNKNVIYIASGQNQVTDKKSYLSATDNEKYFDKLWNSLTE